ncbi:MAG: hypothetical protein WAS51_06105 [Ilumatobacteraceae bacterium]
MAADDTSSFDEARPMISAAQVSSRSATGDIDSADEDLATFAFRWSRELEAATDPEARAEQHQVAGDAATLAIEREDSGGWDFVRTWLRRLADDVQRDRLPSPLPAPLERTAQQVVRSLLEHERDNVVALREATSAARDPLELVRHAPRSAGVLRDLGRVAAVFRGTGVLSLESPDEIADLIAFDEALKSRSRRTFGTVPDHLRITRQDLLQWVDSGAGHDFPGLIRRLIAETSEGLERLHFPAGVGASVGGWDGVVEVAIGNAYVPDGLSAWELSTKKQSNPKAEEDYEKRLAGPEGAATTDVTYVAVICRPWVKAASFASTHSAEGRWRDVRAYNVEDVETWLEGAPGTTIWLAEKLGRPVGGIRALDRWWEDWLASTRLPLRSNIVLAGRDDQTTQLIERVQTGGTTTIGGDVRLEEVHAFIAAVFADSPSAVGVMNPSVVILSDSTDAGKLLTRPGELVAVVPSPTFLHEVQVAPGHHVIVPVLGSDRADIVLPPVSSRLVTEALETEGIGYRDAHDFGALARRSLLGLRRRLAVDPPLHQPGWAAPGADTLRRRLLVVNGWNQTKPGDREAVEQLVGQPYQVIEDSLRSLATVPDDPMVAIFDERWHVVSPMDAWLLLGPQVSASDLAGLRVLALDVLLEPDPTEGLTDDERFRASMEGATRRFSSELTRGVAKSLALLGTVDDVVRVNQGQTGGTAARSIVWELLDAANKDATSATWTRLAPHLPLLAEAAPTVVLTALQEALGAESSFSVDVFGDKERGKFGSPPPSAHTHVLWTLETLVWSPEYFDAAITLLARLAELDPGGQWSNRPSESLANVFCPWHPNTSAPVEQREATLERLRRQFPIVAWNLLVSMLPNAHGFQMVHRGPDYRDWKVAEPVVTRGDYARVVTAVAEALIADVGDDVERWKTLIKELNDLPPDARARVAERLSELASASVFGDAQEAVWKELRDFISHHREYSDTQWALPSEEVDRLAAVAEELAPSSPRHRHGWLFEDGMITLGDIQRRDNFQAYEDAVAARRADAVADIVGAEGFESLRRFAAEVAAPGQVGAALARSSAEEYEADLLSLLGSTDGSEVDLAFGYFAQRFRDGGWPWLDQLLSESHLQSPTVLSLLLRSSWDPSAAGGRADSLGEAVATEYWRNVSYMGLGHDFRDAVAMSRRLIEVGRSVAALDLLAVYGRGQGTTIEFAEAVAQAFEALMEQSEDPELPNLGQYNVDSLLKIVAAHRTEIGLPRAVQIEWYFLPLLGYDPDARTLHQTLAEDPKFFADVLSMVYRPRVPTDGDNAEPATEQQKSAAENAFRLLSSWSICPGADESGRIDPARLRDWISEARDMLAASSRAEVGDEQIGQALAAAPAAEDGSWPCEPVRDLLEELQNDRIDRGLEIRLFNNRGVTTRSLDEGGRQEWDLAEDYRSRSQQLVARWPRTAAVYRRLSESYEADARTEDAKAERRRRGLDD